jgi:hypothetical protein
VGIGEAKPPYWRHCVERVADAIPDNAEAVALVAHSGAGPLMPPLGERLARRVSTYVFVDASIPELAGATPTVPPAFMDSLRALARDGRVPRWSQWWGEEAMAALVPDEALRAQLESEMPAFPLAYFEEEVPVPESWPDAPCCYLQFSPAYEPAAVEARARGWPVERLSGGHLHALVDPGRVAEAIARLVAPGS